MKSSITEKVQFFPPGIPLLAIIIGVYFELHWPSSAVYPLQASVRYLAGGLIVVASIGILGFWPILLMRKEGEKEIPWKPKRRIETRGPYRISRNPIYLQMVLVCVGFSIMLCNWWILLFTPFVACALQWFVINPEEDYLESKFGDRYIAYKYRVRRWL